MRNDPLFAKRVALAFGALLKQHRRMLNMTQKKLAYESGVTLKIIERLECSEPTTPQLDTVIKLASGFDMTLDYFLKDFRP